MNSKQYDVVHYPALVSQESENDSKNLNLEVAMEMSNRGDPKLVSVTKGHPGNTCEENNVGEIDGFHKVHHEELEHENDCPKEEDEESDFDQDLDDHENREEAWAEANAFEKAVLTVQFGCIAGYQFIKKATHGYFLKLVFLAVFAAYFIAAMVHKFGDEGSHRLLGCTLLGLLIWGFPYLEQFVVWMLRKCYGSKRLSERHSVLWGKTKVVIRWLLYIAMTAVMLYFIIEEGRKNRSNLRSLPGIGIFILVALLCSSKPSKVPWQTIFWSVAMQFVCAVIIMKWSFGRDAFMYIQDRFTEFFDNAKAGSKLLFGETYNDHAMAFGAFPLLLFINAAFTVLYYTGAMQFIIRVIGKTLRFVLGVTSVEATTVAVSIFMEGAATIMLLRPFVNKMSKSQLFLLVTACMSSLGGGFVGFMSAFGISLEYLIPAMLISAPATFAISKVMVPETRDIEEEDAEQTYSLMDDEKKKYMNIFDAAQSGALVMLPILITAAVVTYTFFSWVSWINDTLTWFGDRVGIEDLSIELISSYLLYPVALAMGVDLEDCRRVAMLMGYRLGTYNVIAFIKLIEMRGNKFQYLQYMAATNFTGTITKHRDDITLDSWNMTLTNGFISERSEIITIYCLSGFSSCLAAALLTSILATMVPKRKKYINGMAISAVLAGHLSNCMTGCFASLFY
ncbi:hypothetical protein EGW08_010635 [Elysia chlorotica]|uniref:Sodium/nucleoside cotransporter n=1 Tax=Elysia chlorotica TaxID=188477 RepID=A0A433TJ62_ELYCH|nr:hypothetical protein EGW08_010635 [Elysia chlorotica]